jgi:hypothetical protein
MGPRFSTSSRPIERWRFVFVVPRGYAISCPPAARSLVGRVLEGREAVLGTAGLDPQKELAEDAKRKVRCVPGTSRAELYTYERTEGGRRGKGEERQKG